MKLSLARRLLAPLAFWRRKQPSPNWPKVRTRLASLPDGATYDDYVEQLLRETRREIREREAKLRAQMASNAIMQQQIDSAAKGRA